MGNMAPHGQGSPQITYDLTFLNCLRSKGYEPVLSTEGTTRSEAKPTAEGTTRSEAKPTAEGTTRSEAKPTTEGTTRSEAKPKAQGEAQGLSVEDRACITKAAGKLPKIATIEQSRVAPQRQDQGRHEQDLYHVKVEIDVRVA